MAEDSFLNIIEKVSQSTVHINTLQARNYFNRRIPLRGIGSGFVFDENGFIVTNHHVIKEASRIGIVQGDQILKGSVEGSCRNLDIALIKVEDLRLPKLTLGDSDNLRVGQRVYAVGNPLGLEGGPTVTSGVISALNRSIRDQVYLQGLIQTDAAINPGNSGGPLIDLKGDIIGVNTAIIASAQGIGFAIPINSVKECVEQIKKYGSYNAPWIGIEGFSLNPRVSNYYRLESDSGVIITRVVNNSPASKAGLRRGDIIVGFGDVSVKDIRDLQREINLSNIGEVVELVIIRGRRRGKINVIIEGTN
jgi:S1-C subfamily serine protease